MILLRYIDNILLCVFINKTKIENLPLSADLYVCSLKTQCTAIKYATHQIVPRM